jgi:hypothetical protein
VPTFCRHNRFADRCPICASEGSGPEDRAARAARPKAATRRATGVRVRRAARAEADGYASRLVPGVRASADARRLADELSFSAGRLLELESDPPGPYAHVAAAPDPEQALRLAFEIACEREREREPGQAERALAAYGAWAERAGGQLAGLTGDPAWSSERRFDRAFERLSLPGLARAARFDFLVTAGRLGIVDLRAGSLQFQGSDATVVAAKRVFGIGDPLLLDRRARALAEACAVPLEALDLALHNFEHDEDRSTRGASADAADRADGPAIAAALGLG